MDTTSRYSGRYERISAKKATGATYTPKILADFVAIRMLEISKHIICKKQIRIFDPAIGHGELLASILDLLKGNHDLNIVACGFETNEKALNLARTRLKQQFPQVDLRLWTGNFLEYIQKHLDQKSLKQEAYDLIIANPPYVRTQIMGANKARILCKQFGLSGRVDLYHAFIIGMAQVLKPHGVAGIIVSNRFMTTKSGMSVRQAIREEFNIHHIWDMGDTRLFEAAVLPAVLLLEGRNGTRKEPGFTSIYETTETEQAYATNPIDALNKEGVVEIEDGRRFYVQHGKLNTHGSRGAVWRVSTETSDAWLATVEAHTWGTFRDIGKIRVGVKTCADKVYIRSDWQDMPEGERPELLRPLTTHHIARRFRPLELEEHYQILYPHEEVNGCRKPVDLLDYPRTRNYLGKYRAILEERKYVIEAGRKWYEIWVPHNPSAWNAMKLVFRDIAAQSTFWIDQDGTVVNGDCYWLVSERDNQTDLLWLAATVGNSTFIETFYDHRFNNKLYSGRRRFITQYVEQFPLPDPRSTTGKAIIAKAKESYAYINTSKADILANELNDLVWLAFGLSAKEVCR